MAQDGKQVTRVQWQILRYLKRTDVCTIGHLAERMDVRPSTMSQMLDRLEKQGWVMRTASEKDSRVRLIGLTEIGRSFIRSVEALRQDSLTPALRALSPDEQETLVNLLSRVAQTMAEAGQCEGSDACREAPSTEGSAREMGTGE